MKSVTLDDFASYWGESPSHIPQEFQVYLNSENTLHRDSTKEDLENYFSSFVRMVTKPTAQRTVAENRVIFERGWTEHIAQLDKLGCVKEAFVPQYYHDIEPYHRGPEGKVYVSETGNFPAQFQILHMRYLALTLFRPFSRIHEFGSGAGLNLFVLNDTVPGKELIGYEWTNSGVEVANFIGKKSNSEVRGQHFDMFAPDYSVVLNGDAVFTCGSIEQLGDNYDAFLNFLIEKQPGLVVHLEPDGSPSDHASTYRLLSESGTPGKAGGLKEC